MRRNSTKDWCRNWLSARLWRTPRRRTRFGAWSAVERLEGRTLPATTLPVNHAPTDLVLANGYVLENSPAETLVGNFGTADPDPGEQFTYFLAGPSAGMFRVEGDRLLTNGEFDFETRDSYRLLVVSRDSRGASISRQVTVRVMDQFEDQASLGGLQLVTSSHRDVPTSDSVLSHGGYYTATGGIAGSDVVFWSPAPNLVPGDTNNLTDVFVASRDGKKERISVALNGQEANGDSDGAKISRNGRLVAFISSANNLVEDDSNDRSDAFVRDRVSGTTKRVSLRSDGTQFADCHVSEVALSADGRYAAFVVVSYAEFQKDEGGLYVRDLLLGKTKRLIVAKDGEPFPNSISISGEGRRIAFKMFQGDVEQVYVIDRVTGATQLASVSRLGTVRPQHSSAPMISENGRFVVFESEAAGLIEGGENMPGGVFVRDLQKKTTQRVDVAFDGSAPHDSADSATISADGRFVAFRSFAGNSLLPPDSPPTRSAYFVRDLRTGLTQPVVVELEGDQHFHPDRIAPLVSRDGRYVAFSHHASNLVPRDRNDGVDLFLRDTQTNTTELITRRDPKLPSATSISIDGGVISPPSLTADGSQVFFVSFSVTLTPDLFPRSAYHFEPKLFLRPLASPGNIEHLPFNTYGAFVSQNGRFALFQTYESLVPDDTNGLDWYVLDRETGTSARANLSHEGSRLDSFGIAQSGMSDDGRYVGFASSASNVVPGDANGRNDVFVRDLLLGTTTRVSVAPDGTEANGDSDSASLSLDGRFVVFQSFASNLVPDDHNQTRDIFVRDLLLGTTERVSVNSDGQEGNSFSHSPLISGDGQCVAFISYSSNLANSVDSSGSIFWHDRETGTTRSVSVANAQLTSISNDGRFVVFASSESNVVPNDTNQGTDVFVRDMLRDVTLRASVGPNGEQANGESGTGIISGDGTKLAFVTAATNLVPFDFNASGDIIVVDLAMIPEVTAYSVRVDNSQVFEDGATPLTFVFERNNSFDRSETISFRVSGTAKAFSDYQLVGTDGLVTFDVGQSQVLVHFIPVADRLSEITEEIIVTLADDVPSFSSPNQATGLIVDDDRASFSITPPTFAGTVTETGSSLTVFVVLDSQPSANVVLDVLNGDTTEIRLSAKKLTFTPTNWNVPQAVTIRGIDDGLADGDQLTLVSVQINPLTADELFKSTQWLALTSVETLDNGPGRRRG